ncbi:ATP-binding cassette domain-containing protein [Micromonospora sp. NPDC005161]
MPDLLSIKDLVVTFGGVHALDGLDLTVGTGEIHGIIGPNGAGKTTVINAMTGFVAPASGEIRFDGRRLPRQTHRIARLGVGRTFQAPATFPGLNAVENVMSGGDRRLRSGIVGSLVQSPRTRREDSTARAEAGELLERVGFSLPPTTPVTSLPYGEHRKIEIARALMFRPRLLMLDEPTAGLTTSEVSAISDVLRDAMSAADGAMSIILVEHNVPFVFGLCDTVTAFHRGRAIASGTPSQVRAEDSVIESYLGNQADQDASTTVVRRDEPSSTGTSDRHRPTLTVRDLHAGYAKVRVLRGVDMEVAPGELVLVYGRNGAGKSTLLNAIAGSPRPSRGEVLLGDRTLHRMTVSQIVRSGVALVPQERGVISGQSVEDNLLLGCVGLRLGRSESVERRDEVLERFPALRSRVKQLAGTLSGGERQMLALAKVLIRRPEVLLLDEPSIGLAPTIVEGLHDIVASIRAEGLSVIVAEQNVWWVAPLASRAYLLQTGAIEASGSVDSVLARESLISSYLGDADASRSTEVSIQSS